MTDRGLILLLILIALYIPSGVTNAQLDIETWPQALVRAAPEKGFNYPYLLKFPPSFGDRTNVYLVVESNNTGSPSDDLGDHIDSARHTAESGVGAFTASALSLPMLVPAFPRPARASLIYTHALDRDTLEITSGELARLDHQLIAMIDDSREKMRDMGPQFDEKVVIVGFSASGTFANRFSMLHPNRVAVVVAGGINGLPMLPAAELGGFELPYPLGLADYVNVSGRSFDAEEWSQVPQLLFMGGEDENDTLNFDDAYSEAEKQIIRSAIGERMQPDRWERSQDVYGAVAPDIAFRTYEGIGHGTNGAINSEIVQFVEASLGLAATE